METFRFPKPYKWLHLGSLFLFVSCLGLALVVAYLDDSGKSRPYLLAVLAIVVFGPLIWYGLHILRILEDYVQVDESGIWYVSPHQRRRFVQWRDIVVVRARDVLQRLDLCDATGRVTLRLEYQLENFERLRTIIHERTKPHLRDDIEPHKFHRGRSLRVWYVVAIVMFGAAALWARADSEPWAALILLGVALFAAATFLFETQRLEVAPNGLVFVSILRKRLLPFASILGISFKNVSAQYGHEIAVVNLDLVNGKTRQLAGFQEGSFALYKTLESAWTTHQEKQAKTTRTETRVS